MWHWGKRRGMILMRIQEVTKAEIRLLEELPNDDIYDGKGDRK